MVSQPAPTIERLNCARQTLNIYDDILSSLIDVATLKMNDPDYDVSRTLAGVATTLSREEVNKKGISDVEGMCDYRFDFLTTGRALRMLLSKEVNFDSIRFGLKKMRETLRKRE